MNGISTEEQERRDREREAKAAMDSLQKSNEDLLKEIFFYSQDAFSHGPKRTIAYFSSLLINLSKQAEKSTQKIINLTYVLVVFTIALLFVGVMQIRIMINQNTKAEIKINQTQEDNSKPQADYNHSRSIQSLKPEPVIPEKEQINNKETREDKSQKRK